MEHARTHTFADLSRFMKRSPRLVTYVVPTAIFIFLDMLAFRTFYPSSVFFLVPLLLAVVFDRIFVSLANFHFPLRRIFFLNFLSFFIANFYFLILVLLFRNQNLDLLLAIAFCTPGLLRSMIFYAYYTESVSKILLPSMAYTICSALVLFAYLQSYQILVGSIFSALIFSVGGIIFSAISIKDFRNEFGQSPIKILNFFLNIHSKNDKEVGDLFFSKLYGIKRTVPVKVVSIENLGGKRKVLLVFPYVHPGPFGNIGTSNLPFKLWNRTKDLSDEIMVFHTATTNSNNSASEADIDTIAAGIRNAMRNLKYYDQASRIRKLNSGGISVSLLRIGDFGIGSLIPERERFDDVKLTEGLRITEEMISSGASDFAVVDAQNHFSHGAKSLDDCEAVIKTLTREFKRSEPKYPLQVGYSRVAAQALGLGPLGIQCLVFRNGDRTQAIVLTDSNNIKDEVMDLAEKKVDGKVSSLDIFTTDNHFVNQGTLDMNPLGERDDPETIARLIDEAVDKALSNIEDCIAGMGSTNVDVSMGDENMFDNLLTNVFKSVKKAKYSIFGVVSATLVLSFLLFVLIPWSSLFP